MASGGWIGVTAGLISASITLSAGFFLEDYKRHRDRQTLAMSYVRTEPMQMEDRASVVI
jgi:hypothetical protein